MKIPAAMRWTILLFLLVVTGILVWAAGVVFEPFATHLSEPQYQGRKLTEWAQDFVPARYLDSLSNQTLRAKSDRATAVIRHIGTNALPFTLQLCSAKDSWFKRKLEAATSYSSDCVLRYRITPEEEKHELGNNVILVLGPVAKPIMPDLIELLKSSDARTADDVMFALPAIGTNVVPPLVKLLDDTNEAVRIRAAIILARNFSAQAHPALPALIQATESRDINSITRLQVIHSLGFLKTDAAIVLPVLVHHIQSETNIMVLSDYFNALRNLGTNAESAIPFLLHILKSNPKQPYSWTKEKALGSLMKIAPAIAEPLVSQWREHFAASTNLSSQTRP